MGRIRTSSLSFLSLACVSACLLAGPAGARSFSMASVLHKRAALGGRAMRAPFARPSSANRGNSPTGAEAFSFGPLNGSDNTLPDGSGGAFVLWSSWRFQFPSGVYLQRVDSTGAHNASWPPFGLDVSPLNRFSFAASMVPDGSGGVVVLWLDLDPVGNTSLRAQLVSASGLSQWAPDGIVVHSASSFEDFTDFPAFAADGSGGFVVAWSDDRAGPGEFDIYAQKLNGGGALQWAPGGVPVCVADGEQTNVLLARDGAGGMFAIWADGRAAGAGEYAQRLNGSGAPQWTVDGLKLVDVPLTAFGSGGGVASDGAGGLLATWNDALRATRVQRFDSAGSEQWTAGGVVVDALSLSTFTGRLVEDGNHGAIVTWAGQRGLTLAMFAQRLNAAGVPQWGANGLTVRSAPGSRFPLTIASDGAGSTVVAWSEFVPTDPLPSSAWAQALNPDGSAAWAPGGVRLGIPGAFPITGVLALAGRGAIFTWTESREGSAELDLEQGLYAQRLDGAGTPKWGANGTTLEAPAISQREPSMAPDGAGGAIITWKDCRNRNWDIYASRTNGSGAAVWNATAAVSTAPDAQIHPRAISDGSLGAFVTWLDHRSGYHWDLYGQRLSATGAPLWPANGIPLVTGPLWDIGVEPVADQNHGFFVAWEDSATGFSSVQRFNANGTPVWAQPVAFWNQSGFANDVVIASDGSNGVLVTWDADTGFGTDVDVLAQHIDANGNELWGAPGLGTPVAVADTVQEFPAIVSDGASGAFVAWEDLRRGERNVYAQHVNSSGDTTLTASLALSDILAKSVLLAIVGDGAGGFIAGWLDGRNSTQGFYGQRVNASGSRQWGPGGLTLAPATLVFPAGLWPLSGGGLLYTWVDVRANDWNLFAQRLSPAGTLAWGALGAAVTTAPGRQGFAPILDDGAGGAIVAWQDYRTPPSDFIYQQRLNAAGAPLWAINGGVPTLAALAQLDVRPGRVAIRWQVSGPGGGLVTVERKLEDEDWRSRGVYGADGSGFVEFVDEDVSPGQHIGYRVRLGTTANAPATAETWVDIPLWALEFAVRQDRASRSPRAEFTLPVEGTVRIDWLDLAGRHVGDVTTGMLSAGPHSLALDRLASAPTGVYWARFFFGDQMRVARVVVLH